MGRVSVTRRRTQDPRAARRGSRDRRRHGNSHGVTIIELVLALAVVGILSALALPAYDRHLLRAQRTDAIVPLLELSARQQQHFSRTLRFTDEVAALGYAAAGSPHSTHSPDGHYVITLTADTDAQGPYWHAVAEPLGRQQRDTRCLSLEIHGDGRRVSRDQAGRDTSGTCWGRGPR